MAFKEMVWVLMALVTALIIAGLAVFSIIGFFDEEVHPFLRGCYIVVACVLVATLEALIEAGVVVA